MGVIANNHCSGLFGCNTISDWLSFPIHDRERHQLLGGEDQPEDVILTSVRSQHNTYKVAYRTVQTRGVVPVSV